MNSGLITKIKALLAHRHIPLIAAGLAILLTLPSLGAGLLIDDHFVRLVVRQPENLPIKLPHPLDTFSFINNEGDYIPDSMEFGALPWWSSSEVKGCFWRPLTAMTHYIDHKLWPDQVWLMHLQSVLWYGALVLAAGVVFKRLMGTALPAGLAALFFAVEEAHAMPVGWLANRNSIVACLFGMLALILHHSWRKDGKHVKGLAALVMFTASLFAAEAGISTMAYITAYALVLEKGAWRKRLTSLIPYIVIIVVWRGIWAALGYGTFGMPLYVDPLREPWIFIQKFFIRLPQLITGQFALPATEIQLYAMIVNAWTWLFSAAVTVLVLMLFWPMIKADRTARFFALGALFALVPACATIAQNRLLVFVGIGAFGLLALWLTNRPNEVAWPRGMKAVSVVLIVLHLIIAPLLLPLLSFYPIGPGPKDNWSKPMPITDAIEGRDLIIVNYPIPVLMTYYLGDRAIEGQPLPAHTRVLAHDATPLTIRRLSPSQLQLVAANGFPDYFSRIVNLVSARLREGDSVELEGLTVQIITADASGAPTEAVFTFDRDIDDASLKWLQWSQNSFKPFIPPAIGEEIEIPGVPYPPGVDHEKIVRWIDRLGASGPRSDTP